MRVSETLSWFLIAAALCSGQSRDDRWREDLEFLQQQIRTRHPNPFTRITEAEFQELSLRVRQNIPTRNDTQLAVDLARLTASIGDAHTSLSPTQANARVSFVPLRLRWFPDGLYVTQAAEVHARAIGKRVTRIGGVPAEDVFATLRQYVSHENENWARLLSANLAASPEILEAAGLAAGVGPITYEFEDFELIAPVAALPLVNAPYLSQPKFPLYRRNSAQPYWFEYLAEHKTIYFQYNQCRDTPALPFERFAREFIQFAEANPVDRLIFDFRNNGGGNSAVLIPLLEGLGRSVLAGKVNLTKGSYLLIGRQTFSSASLNAAEIKAQGATILIGEPTGGGASGFGEVAPFTLPHSRLSGQVSTKLFTISGFPGTAINPDVPVDLTSADFFADLDPVLDKALSLR
jgi:hypothetical protein